MWASGYLFSGDKTIFHRPEPAAQNGRVIFLYASAVHALGALTDTEADISAEYRTIATALGGRGAALFSMLCL